MGAKSFRTKIGFSIDGKFEIIRGTTDPTQNGGVVAPVSSLYARENTGSGTWYIKSGTADTAWEQIPIGVGATEEDGYQNNFIGKSIGSVLPDYATENIVTDDDTLLVALGKIDTHMGAKITSGQASRTKEPIGNNPVQSNILKLDLAIGDDPTSTNFVSTTNTVNQNISLLDAKSFDLDGRVNSLESGQKWIESCAFITSEDISSRSGLSAFSDDDGANQPPSTGDRVVSTFDNKIYVASSGAWGSGVDLNSGETFFVDNDLLASSDFNEKTSAYTFNGTSCVRSAQIDFESAGSINVTSGYSASAGNPIASESVQSVLQKLDGNNDAQDQSIGINQGDTNLGAFTGTGATRILTDNTESAKSSVEKIANDIGSVTNTTVLDTNNTVGENLDILGGLMAKDRKEINTTISSATTTTIDTVPVSNECAIWDIVIFQTSTPDNRYKSTIEATFEGSSIDFTEFGILELGTGVTPVTLEAVINGANVELQATATGTGGLTVKGTRRIV